MSLITCEIATVSSVTERKLHHVPSVSKGKAQGVRRLPVVSKEGVPLTVISIDDVITYGDLNKWEECCELSSDEIIRSLKKLYGQKSPIVRAKSAAA